jgi:DNA invertase Pin-like site-specific DNA recombinase
MTSTGSRTASARTKPVDTPASTPRAAIYLRVSTGRQAEQELSIPDQRAQTQAWAAQRGWRVGAEYIDGTSATDDKRPEFQRMIERACDGENAFDVIVVHSFSRFFRDAFGLEFYVRRLAKDGVRLVSITQELGDEPAQVIRLFLSSVNRSSWYPWSTLARSELCKKRSR